MQNNNFVDSVWQWQWLNKNIVTAIKRWPACRANPNRSFGVLSLILRASRYLSARGDGLIALSPSKGGRLTLGGGGGSKCNDRISGANFLIVFHSNYGSILFRFQDMTTGQTDVDNQHISGPYSGPATYEPNEVLMPCHVQQKIARFTWWSVTVMSLRVKKWCRTAGIMVEDTTETGRN